MVQCAQLFCVLSGEVKIEIRLSTYRKNHVAYPFLLSTVGFILVILVSDFQPVIDGVVFSQPLPCLLRNPVQLGYIYEKGARENVELN